MTNFFLSLHNITDITVVPVEAHTTARGEPYVVRRMIVTSTTGVFEITFFSDNAEKIAIKLPML
jgi:hypothetical protein